MLQLEWLTALPWPNMATPNQSPTTTLSTKVFLANARAQLDADHFGLDKVKRRLIEFLAVVRLKEANAAAEAAKSDQKQQQPANKGPILLYV
jgi:ATP-dependent Lon protease